MKHILLDTNCWISLLSEENEYNLKTIEYWIIEGKLKLLIPEALSKQWAKQKQIQFDRIAKTQNEALPKIKSFKALVKLEHNYIQERIDKIDHLFSIGKLIKANKSVRADVTDRYGRNKAPFHHENNNSNSDALILLSSISVAQKTKEKKLIFITHDADDFGDRSDNSLLHADFKTETVEISYFTNIGKAVNILKSEFGNFPMPLLANKTGDFVPILYLLPQHQNNNLIDQLFYSLTKAQEQISKIPANILVRIYPLKIENLKYNFSYHSPFQINTNNFELVRLFNHLKNQKGSKINPAEEEFGLRKKGNKEKIKKINKVLNDNLIFSINSVDNKQQVDINVQENVMCDCVLCAYNRFDFLSSFSNLSSAPLEDERETLKHAYVHFQFGNFIQSVKLFYHVYRQSEKNKKYLRSFICLYNLKRLNRYIQGYLPQPDAETREILAEVEKKTFASHILIASSDNFIKENIEWISNTDFLNDSFQKVVSIVSKIQDHYHTQLSGNWSTNSNYHLLIGEFGEVDSFLDHNSIIYNNYSEFEDLGNKFLEGLFMIYSFDERQSQRISALDDSLLLLIAKFSKRETIIKNYNRLQLSSLKYVHSSTNEPNLEKIIIQLIQDYKEFKKKFGGNNTVVKSFFWDKYKKIFSNLILFITISDSETTDYNMIFNALIRFWPDQNLLAKFDENIISDLLQQKGKFFASEQVEVFLRLAINDEKLHTGQIFYSLKNVISKYHPNIVISVKKTYDQIIKNFLEECPKCKSIHEIDIAINIYFLLSPLLKIQLKSFLNRLLFNEFNPDVYYKLSMFEILDYKDFF